MIQNILRLLSFEIKTPYPKNRLQNIKIMSTKNNINQKFKPRVDER